MDIRESKVGVSVSVSGITWALLEKCADRRVGSNLMSFHGVRYAAWGDSPVQLRKTSGVIYFGLVGDRTNYRMVMENWSARIEVEVPIQTTAWVPSEEAAEYGVRSAFSRSKSDGD